VRNQVIKGVFWLASAKAIGQVLTWIISIVVVRLLSPQDYGLMGMAILFTGFLLLFNELGLGSAIIQRQDLQKDQLSSLRWVVFVANVALFLAIAAIAPWVAAYFNEPRLVSIVRALGTSFVVNGIGLPSAYLLQRNMEFKKKASAELFGSLVGAVTTLVLAVMGYGVWSLVLGSLALNAGSNLAYCVFAPPILSHAFSYRRIQDFVGFGFKIAVSRVLWYVASNADFMIVGRVLGTVQLGFYSLAFQFSSLPLDKLVTLITQVAYPSFSAMQNDDKRLRASYLEITSAVALITFPIFIGLALVAHDAIEVFLTSRWLPVVVPMQLLCVVSCLRAVENLNAPLLVAKGQGGLLLRNGFAQAAVMPATFYIGAQYGIAGVAWGWLIVRPVLFVIMTAWSIRVVGLSFFKYLGGLKHATAGSLAMVVAVLLCRTLFLAMASPKVDLAVSTIVGVLVYAIYNLVFNHDDVQRALSLVRTRRTPAAPPVPVRVMDGKTETNVAFSGR
jgi:O-antigen/teichoic acid export membrane protein